METWRAIMTKGVYPYADSAASKASRYGVLDDESDKLQQPLISRHDDEALCGYDSDRLAEDGDGDDDVERGRYYGSSTEKERLLGKQPHGGDNWRQYEEPPLKPSPTALLRSIMTNVLWPMTAVGAQTAKVYEPRVASTFQVDGRRTMPTVATLRSLTKSRRRSETLEEIHEKALVRIALATVFFSAWLIITVYRHAE